MSPAAGSDRPAEFNDLRSLLHEEVSLLPAKYRAPVVLRYFEGAHTRKRPGPSAGRWEPFVFVWLELVTCSDRGSPAAASRPPW